MKFSRLRELKDTLRADAHRYGKTPLKCMLNPGYRYTFWLRITACLYRRGGVKIPFHISNAILRHYKYKYGIEISYKTSIGKGLYIGHFGGIVVNAQAKLGMNVNLSHGVTIGSNNRGKHQGTPTIGNNVSPCGDKCTNKP